MLQLILLTGIAIYYVESIGPICLILLRGAWETVLYAGTKNKIPKGLKPLSFLFSLLKVPFFGSQNRGMSIHLIILLLQPNGHKKEVHI